MSLNEIQMQVDFAYGLLNQREVIHFQGKEFVHKKEVTPEDIERVKNVLKDVYNNIDAFKEKLMEAIV